MLKRTSLIVVGLTLICFASSAFSQKRGPSTPEERKRAVEMAAFLEEKPLAKEAKDYRAALLYFLAGVPDITVKTFKYLYCWADRSASRETTTLSWWVGGEIYY